MNPGQLAIVGLGALLVVGIGAALMMSGGDGPDDGLGGGADVVPPPATSTAQPGTAPEPLKPVTQVGSGATVATARATHYDPDNPPPPPKAEALDYVCKRHVDPSKSVKFVLEGQNYYFCSDACLAKFKEDPHTLLHKRSLGE